MEINDKIKTALLAIILAMLGYVGNYLDLPLAYSISFLFGSIFVIISLFFCGIYWGILASIVASSYTYTLWNHPYAIIIFTAEAIWIGLSLKKNKTNIILSDAWYWLVIGIPLVILFYFGIMRLGFQQVLVVVFKQTINGISNAIVAGIIIDHSPLRKCLKIKRETSYADIIFQLTAFFLIFPAIALMSYSNYRESLRIEQMLVDIVEREAIQAQKIVEEWISIHLRAAKAIAELGQRHEIRHSPKLQEELEHIAKLFPDFHNVYVADSNATTVAFYPPVNEKGESTIGLDFADRPYYKEMLSTLQPFISEVFLARGGLFDPTFTISAPIVEKGRLAGFGLGAVNLEKLRVLLANFSSGNQFLVTISDGNQNVVVSNNPRHRTLTPLKPLPDLQIRSIAHGLLLWIPDMKKNISIMDSWKNSCYFLTRPIEGTPWRLRLEVPVAPLARHFYQGTVINLAVVSIFFGLAIGISFLTSRYVFQTPALIAAISKDIPTKIASQQRIVWPQTSIAEMKLLITNFQQTAEALGSQIQKFREANVSLEQRVQERTAMLAAVYHAQSDYIIHKDIKKAFVKFLEEILQFTDCKYGFLAEVLYEANESPDLKIHAIMNIDGNRESMDFYQKNADDMKFQNLQTLFGMAFATGKPIISHNPAKDFRQGWLPAGHPPIESFLGIPIKFGNQLIGMIGLANRTGGFADNFLQSLMPLTSACAQIIISHRDELLRQESERSLRESRKQFSLLLHSAPEAVIITDNKGTITIVNDQATKLFGYSEQELIGNKIAMLVPIEKRDDHEELVKGYLQFPVTREMGKGREVKARRKDGREFKAEIGLSAIDTSSGLLVIAVVNDITEQIALREKILKNLEEEKRMSQIKSRFVSILNAAVDAIITVSSKGIIESINPSGEKMFGYKADELIGQKIKVLLPVAGNSLYVTPIEQSARLRPTNVVGEVQGRRKDGSLFYLDATVSIVNLGETFIWTTILRDITERKTAEAALAHARAQEVEIGSRIQQSLLLGTPPQGMENVQIATFSLASQKIDGDFYDFFVYNSQKFDLILGDVMGKGIPAALVAAGTKSHYLKVISRLLLADAKKLPEPADIINRMHADLTKRIIALETFVTMIYARFDLENKKLKFVNCGHPKLIHYHASIGRCELLEGINVPIGFLEQEHYDQIEVPFDEGDILFFYSDGITEAKNPSGEFFGEESLVDIIQKNGGLAPGDLIESIHQAVVQHTRAMTFGDDLTCAAVKVKKSIQTHIAVRWELDILSAFSELARLRDFVEQFCQQLSSPEVDENFIYPVQLAVHEAATNIMKHAYEEHSDRPVHVKIELLQRQIVVTLSHQGKGFDLDNVEEPAFDGSKDHGFGIFIIQQIMDNVEYGEDVMRWKYVRMVKKIPEKQDFMEGKVTS